MEKLRITLSFTIRHQYHFQCACLLTTCFPVPTVFFEEGWSVQHLFQAGAKKTNQIKACQVVRHENLWRPLRNPLSEKFTLSSSYS
jgi:hypothetical protein